EPGKKCTARYRLFTEGIDNDKDGKINEDEPGGVDISRNFPFGFVHFDAETGDYQLSESESRAVVDFMFDYPNIAAVFSFSQYGDLIFPWESYSAAPPEDLPLTKVFADDQKYFTSIAEMYKDSTGLKNAPEYKRNGGQLDQWVYFHFGRWSFSAPAWWPPEIKEKPDSTKNGKSDSIKVEKPKIDPKTDSIKNLRRLYKWLQHTGQQNKFLEWQEIKHPDFPHQKVEIGGFTPYTEFVPVVDSLAVRSKRMNRFLILLAQKLPAVVIQNIYVEHLGALVFRIHLVVVNNGYLPSNNKMGEKLKWARSVKAEILLDKTQELKSGRKYHLLESIPGDGAGRQLTWIVSSPPGKKVTVRVGSPMTGTVEKTVTLKE
ncbi:hypothetical protein JW935_14740, partial [candidate division KSB1 bacterium]|nr:hypothetical protein [candidate division KSB1 bacterium]